ncbi:MAG TPA: amino acid permease, partial [Longimicrobiales bacterium]|nr:amino acid permease [Longimicrobiales bacterium]
AYLGQFLRLDQTGVRVAAATAILIVALANVRSVLWGAAIENATTAAKVVALAGLAIVAFILGNGHAGALASPATNLGTVSWGAVGVTLIAVLWAYDGWADLTFMAGEVKDPGRTLPRALVGGTLIVVAVYLLVNAAYLYVLPLDAVAQSHLVAADAATAVIGRAGASVVAALVMLSTFGTLNGSTMTGPRILWAMADDGLFFKPIAAVHRRFATPWVAILLAAGLGIAYVSFNTFEQLADAFILGIWPFYALGVLAVIRLRHLQPDAERPYRTPGYPVVPLVFLLASLGLLGNALIQEPVATGIGFAVILLGIPVFIVWQRLRA